MDVSEAVIEEEGKVADGVEIAAEGVEEKSASVVEEDESEWPSLKLDAGDNMSVTSQSDPNLASESNVIPGLPSAESLKTPSEVSEEQDDKGSADPSTHARIDNSPLGELRFQND